MVIVYGDVVWLDLPPAAGSAPGGKRPGVVLQQDRFNRSRIQTVVVAAISSNLKLASAPGNVRLRKGEAGLPRASVVNVSQLMAIDRDSIAGKLGRLSGARLASVWSGLRLLLEPPPQVLALGDTES
jgi:mRNA interferase MazF